ncbi:MAG: hypothetical protein ACI9E1_000004 [Cryomorphaceae bacterium]|jgi:hypothetical protein
MNNLINQLIIHPISEIKSQNFTHLLSPPDNGGVVVTLLLPMERKGAETRKNPIVFKNAIKKAEDMLSQEQRDTSEIGRVLKQHKEMHNENSDFWQTQQNGLAMVMNESGELNAFKTPFPLEEFVWVGKRPRLGRLMPLTDELRFYILALGLDKLRLFEATRWNIDEIDLVHVPSCLEDVTKYDDPEKSLQHHSAGSSPRSGGKVTAIHHGQGGGTDDTKSKSIHRYFEMIDKNLPSHFDDLSIPLVLFGQDSPVGNYREVNSYPHLHEDDIRFNPGNQSEDELKKRIYYWVQEQAFIDVEKSIKSLHSHIGQGQGSAEFNEVIKAAFTGRVATLFVKKGAVHYGSYDPGYHTVTSHDSDTAGTNENELIEEAVMQVTAAGGSVRYLASEEKTVAADIAATFRF